MLIVSIVIMSLIWFAFAAILVLLVPEGAQDWRSDDTKFACGVAFVLVIIPFQLVRYYRDWRRL